jgi:hypothetical protein
MTRGRNRGLRAVIILAVTAGAAASSCRDDNDPASECVQRRCLWNPETQQFDRECTVQSTPSACDGGSRNTLGSPPQAQGTDLLLTTAHGGQQVPVRVGQRIEVWLETQDAGRFGDPIVSSPAIRFLSMSSLSFRNGFGASQRYEFEVIAPSRVEIRIPRSPPTGEDFVVVLVSH